MKITTPTATAWDADLRDRTSILQHSTRTLQPCPAYRSFRAGEDKMSPARGLQYQVPRILFVRPRIFGTGKRQAYSPRQFDR